MLCALTHVLESGTSIRTARCSIDAASDGRRAQLAITVEIILLMRGSLCLKRRSKASSAGRIMCLPDTWASSSAITSMCPCIERRAMAMDELRKAGRDARDASAMVTRPRVA